VFRTHEGNLPDASLQVYSDSETAKAFSYWAKQFADLFEYRKQLSKTLPSRAGLQCDPSGLNTQAVAYAMKSMTSSFLVIATWSPLC
jgi:hypothetical protein